MAPTARSLHALVAKNVKILRLAWKKTSIFVQSQIPASVTRPITEFQPVLARVAPRQPIHPAAFLKQSKRWLSSNNGFDSSIRRFSSIPARGALSVRYERASFPKSSVASVINLSAGRAPFASTLRPNLTGGTLGRTAGGYSIGAGRIGGARYFSHTPAAPAQVVRSINQAIRAFTLGGKMAQFDGVNPRTGEHRYKSVTALQKQVAKKIFIAPKAAPGSFVDFSINPTITALAPLGTVSGFSVSQRNLDTLNTEGLLDILSVDFSRALRDLAIILKDLQKLSTLGDLPISYQDSQLRVHFPGCDGDTVETLVKELGIQRGVIGQDEDFDAYNGTEIALLFPFAPSRTPSEYSFYERPLGDRKIKQGRLWWDDLAILPETPPSPILANLSTPDFSTLSDPGIGMDYLHNNPWNSPVTGFETVHSSELGSSTQWHKQFSNHSQQSPSEYQGIAGIYRFVEHCDAISRR